MKKNDRDRKNDTDDIVTILAACCNQKSRGGELPSNEVCCRARRDAYCSLLSSSMIALITPVSGRVYDGNTSITSANAVRCVIHGRVSSFPSSMSRMMLGKSSGSAL